MIKVYIASKLKYAEQFRSMRLAWEMEGIDLHARWFDQAIYELEGEVSKDEFHVFWLVDEEDVKVSDALIIYGEKEDKLRGALVEAGIALAQGKMIIVIGDSPDFGTWQYHPVVIRASSFEHAKSLLRKRFL
jgi:hypothetical protein